MEKQILQTVLITAVLTATAIFKSSASFRDGVSPDSYSQELQELVVTADQNLFKIKGANRFVYEVYKDSTLKGANTLDALARVPILAVKKTGSIEAMNGQELIFKLNGLHDPVLKSLEQALTAIPAEVIKTIELREENSDEGKPVWEVNIVTKGRLEGYRMLLNTTLYDSQWRNSVWAVTKLKRLTMTGSYFNLWQWGHKSTSGQQEYRYDTPETYLYVTDSEDEGYKADFHNFELSASYDVDDRSFIYVFGRALHKHDPRRKQSACTSIFSQDGGLTASYDCNDIMKLKDNEYYFSLQYERDLTEDKLPGNLNIGYQFYSRPLDQTNISTYTVTDHAPDANISFLNLNDSRRRRRNTEVTNTIVANWSKEINHNMKWEIYAKGRTRNEGYTNDITMTPVLIESQSISESYTTGLLEHWGSLTPKFSYYRNHRWEVRGGFAAQAYRHRIHATGQESPIVRKRINILPFASTAIATRRNMILRLSYDMSRLVPDINALNPYVLRTQAGELSYGNPDLKPETGHRLILEISGKTGKLYSGGYMTCTQSKDVALRYRFVRDGILNTTYGNIATRRGVSFSGYSSGRVHRNTYLRLTAASDWNQYRSEQLGQSNCGWSFNCRAYIERELPWDITLSAEATYRSPVILLQARGSHSFSYDINLYKQFFKRRLTVMLDADSFIPIWYRQDSSAFGPSFSSTSWDRSFHASFSLTLRYEFGKLKANVKSGSADMDNPDIKQSYSR